MSRPLVSIVLPTRNGAATLPALFDAISEQRADFPFETVVVDTASTDGTTELVRRRADRVVEIAADKFNHGLTRNLGIEHARGDLIVLTVQDALPVSDSWLALLTAPLVADERIAGAFARQLPSPGASALTRHYLSRWVAASDVPRTISVDDRATFNALDPMARFDRCVFDNVCSCIRRSAWSRYPFHETPIAEDLEWAREVLLAGYRLAYVPQAQVFHSHERPARYELARTRILHRRLYELFGLRTIPTLGHLARAVSSSLRLHLREAGALDGRAMALAFAWPLGQYLGALSAVRGWKPTRSRMV